MILRRNEYKEFEKRLGYRFKDKSLLATALIHRSYRFENEDVSSDNQRLEFLGDAVLGFLSADHLFERYPDDDEGVMTSMRSQVTSGKALADIALSVNVGEYLKMGKGEEASGGRERASNLADAFEAILGAAWLDGGSRAVTKIFMKVVVPCIDSLSGDVWADNPKGKLQEYSQREFKNSPKYTIVSKDGPQHACIFTVEASLSNGIKETGQGSNKREAEVEAASKILKKISDEI